MISKNRGSFFLYLSVWLVAVANAPVEGEATTASTTAAKMDRSLIVGGQDWGVEPTFGHGNFVSGSGPCGGVLVHIDMFLTAAHCESNFRRRVTIGTNRFDLGGTRASVEDTIPHPGYRWETDGERTTAIENDLLLLKLDVSFQQSDATFMNFDQDDASSGTWAYTIGFGVVDSNGRTSNTLRGVFGRISETYPCVGGDQYPGMICFTSSVGAACGGDSGGPLFVDGRLVGIHSFGDCNGNLLDGYFGIDLYTRTRSFFMRLSFYEEWIKKTICEVSDYPPLHCFSPTGPQPIPTPRPQSSPNGAPTQDFDCRSSNQCGACQGNCIRDRHCQGNLICFEPADGGYVPGCGRVGDWPRPRLYCIELPRPDGWLVNLGTGKCTSDRPCGRCQGDCDRNSDCEGNLFCFRRSMSSDDTVWGCRGTDDEGTDYCIQKPEPDGNLQYLGFGGCTKSDRCGKCQGDCDADEDCHGDLVCYKGSGRVPGCHGPRKTNARHYCIVSEEEEEEEPMPSWSRPPPTPRPIPAPDPTPRSPRPPATYPTHKEPEPIHVLPSATGTEPALGLPPPHEDRVDWTPPSVVKNLPDPTPVFSERPKPMLESDKIPSAILRINAFPPQAPTLPAVPTPSEIPDAALRLSQSMASRRSSDSTQRTGGVMVATIILISVVFGGLALRFRSSRRLATSEVEDEHPDKEESSIPKGTGDRL